MFQFTIWSFVVPAALISSYSTGVYRTRQAGIPERRTENAMLWAIGVGFIVSHVVEILLYQPHRLEEEGFLVLLKFWTGLSSLGGFAGGAAALVVFYAFHRRKWWREADFMFEGLIIAWIFGRFGCTVALDHPGPKTDFFLAFTASDGMRHNMGFYELLLTLLVLVPVNLLLRKVKSPVGSHVAWNCLLYGAGRFALDFGRATDITHPDPRYAGGFTLAQFMSMGLIIFGAWVLVQARRGRFEDPPGKTAPPPP